MGNITHETVSKSKEEIKYRVGQLNVNKTHRRIVTFHFLNQVNVKCSCAKFEIYVILCKHNLYVIKKNHVEILPNHYILPRWILDARFKVVNSNIGLEEIDNKNGVSLLTVRCIHANYTKAIDIARDSPVEIRKFNIFLVEFIEDQLIRKNPKGHQSTS